MLGVEICHFLYLRPVAYITACTTVQAVILLFSLIWFFYLQNLHIYTGLNCIEICSSLSSSSGGALFSEHNRLHKLTTFWTVLCPLPRRVEAEVVWFDGICCTIKTYNSTGWNSTGLLDVVFGATKKRSVNRWLLVHACTLVFAYLTTKKVFPWRCHSERHRTQRTDDVGFQWNPDVPLGKKFDGKPFVAILLR